MIYFDKECEPANDIVVLKVIESDTITTKKDGFVIGDDMMRNMRVGFYQIVKIGSEAKKKTSLDVGSYVFADRLASFYHTEPIALMRYNALIMESNKEKTKYRALGGRCIVQPIEYGKNEGNQSGFSFAIPESQDLKYGIVKSITPPYEGDDGNNASNIKAGDKILLTKEECDVLHGFRGDETLDPTKPIYIYKTSAILCKICEEN